MSTQPALFDRVTLWECGIPEECIKGRGNCRFQPCTVAQEVRCCAACRRCVNPCPRVRKAGKPTRNA